MIRPASRVTRDVTASGALAAIWMLASALGAASWPSEAELERSGARIGSIAFRALPIFDPAHPEERKAIYRFAERLHVDTRPGVIEQQLLFRSGDPYSRRVLDETERNLRKLRFILDPEIHIVGYRDGLVDLEIVTREVWTTNPGISFGRSGGENSAGVELEELNVLGLGKQLFFDYSNDVDRSTYIVRWHDPGIFGSRWTSTIALRDSDDGTGQSLELDRPFYSLDSRWSAHMGLDRNQAVERVYRLGEPVAGYGVEYDAAELSFGSSQGLRGRWARRWIAGFRQDRSAFSPAADMAMPPTPPSDRALDHLFVRMEAVEDDFETTRNRDQIGRVEDLQFGLQYSLELAMAAPPIGADRSSALLRAEGGRGFRLGRDAALFIGGSAQTRIERGSFADSRVSAALRFYRPTGPKGTLFALLSAEAGHALDADHEMTIGGDSGLRGYPLRYQAGSGRALLTVEQRMYSSRSLWRLADIGGAVFFDAGRAWGRAPLGSSPDHGILRNVGFGLRLASRKTGLANVVHIDIAFPLDGPSSLDQAQFLVQTKRSF